MQRTESCRGNDRLKGAAAGAAGLEDLGTRSSRQCAFVQGLVAGEREGQLSTPSNRDDHFFSSPRTNTKKTGINLQLAT